MTVGRGILVASLALATACSRDSPSSTATDPSASRPRVFESKLPMWEQLAPAGGSGVIEVDVAQFYEAAVLHRDLARAAPSATELGWLAVTAGECGLQLPGDMWKLVLVSYPSGNLGVLTGEFDEATMTKCIIALDPDAAREQLGGALAINVSGNAWMTAPRDGVLLASHRPLLSATLAPDTERFSSDAHLSALLDRVPTHHMVRVAVNVSPGLGAQIMSRAGGLIDQPPTTVTGFMNVGAELDAGLTVTFASDDDAASATDWYQRSAEEIIHLVGRGKIDFVSERVSVAVDRRRVVVRIRVSGDELSRLIAFALEPGPPPDTRTFSSGIDDREIPRTTR